jgi:hypothetical protein
MDCGIDYKFKDCAGKRQAFPSEIANTARNTSTTFAIIRAGTQCFYTAGASQQFNYLIMAFPLAGWTGVFLLNLFAPSHDDFIFEL